MSSCTDTFKTYCSLFTHTFHKIAIRHSDNYISVSDDDDVPSYSKSYESSNGYFIITAGNVLPSSGNYRVAVYSYGYEKREEIEVIIASTDTDYKKIERVTLFGTRVQNVDFEVRNLKFYFFL